MLDVGGVGVSLMTIPLFAIVSVPAPKLPILSPPPGLLLQVEPARHSHRTSRAGEKDKLELVTINEQLEAAK
jgi:hypothetical protein